MGRFRHPKLVQVFLILAAEVTPDLPCKANSERTEGECEDEIVGSQKQIRAHPFRAGHCLLVVGCLACAACPVPAVWHSSETQAQTAGAQTQQAQPSQTQAPQDSDIPDAPTVQPSATPRSRRPSPSRRKRSPVADRNPWTNQPNPTRPIPAPRAGRLRGRRAPPAAAHASGQDRSAGHLRQRPRTRRSSFTPTWYTQLSCSFRSP